MSILKTLANLFGKKPQRTIQKRATFRPRLEALEDRTAPTTQNFWIGASGGAWSIGSNWSLGHVPTSLEEADFGGPSGTDTASTDDIPSLTVQRFFMYSDFTSTITFGAVSAPVSVTSLSDLTQYGTFSLPSGSSLTATTNFYQNGAVSAGFGASITAGDGIVLIGPTTVTAPGPSGSPGLTLSGAIDQSGTIGYLGPAVLLLTGGSYTLTSAGSDTIPSGGSLQYSGISGSIINIQGTITLSGAATITTNQTLNLSGTIVTSGSGDAITGAVTNNGNIQWSGPFHNFTITGAYTQSGSGAGALNMRINGTSNDTLTVSGTATLGGSLNVTATGTILPGLLWNLVICNNPFSGTFSSDSLPPPPPGRSWSSGTTFNGTNWVFQIWD
jgi:hypothetical protein